MGFFEDIEIYRQQYKNIHWRTGTVDPSGGSSREGHCLDTGSEIKEIFNSEGKVVGVTVGEPEPTGHLDPITHHHNSGSLNWVEPNPLKQSNTTGQELTFTPGIAPNTTNLNEITFTPQGGGMSNITTNENNGLWQEELSYEAMISLSEDLLVLDLENLDNIDLADLVKFWQESTADDYTGELSNDAENGQEVLQRVFAAAMQKMIEEGNETTT